MIVQQRNDVDTFLVQLSTDPLTAVTEYYAGCLPNNPKAIEYLRRNEILGPSLKGDTGSHQFTWEFDCSPAEG